MLSDEKRRELTEKFTQEVSKKSAEIDEGDELDWFALSIGWGLANGLNAEDANTLAIFLRYIVHYDPNFIWEEGKF